MDDVGGGAVGSKGLQILLGLIGTVAIVAGGATLLFGADSLLDHGPIAPSVDSELRFYAAWYVVVGVMLLAGLRQLESATTIVRAVGGGFFLAACARALSWATVGRPPTFSIVLMVIEFVIPLVIVPWHARVTGETLRG